MEKLTEKKQDKQLITNSAELLKQPYQNEAGTSLITLKALSTLRNERFLRKGIPYLRVGQRGIRYKTSDIIAYMEERRINFD